ncbi:hypothetical protein [Azorhizobium caulinodans]|uniref:hypothetical protein n=1 Tax=Azorhizobium caulinodans TaxID=7 RepID=UPI0011D14BD8|nr:hypothetical protein [Azorhizobium caulinodans]
MTRRRKADTPTDPAQETSPAPVSAVTAPEGAPPVPPFIPEPVPAPNPRITRFGSILRIDH